MKNISIQAENPGLVSETGEDFQPRQMGWKSPCYRNGISPQAEKRTWEFVVIVFSVNKMASAKKGNGFRLSAPVKICHKITIKFQPPFPGWNLPCNHTLRCIILPCFFFKYRQEPLLHVNVNLSILKTRSQKWHVICKSRLNKFSNFNYFQMIITVSLHFGNRSAFEKSKTSNVVSASCVQLYVLRARVVFHANIPIYPENTPYLTYIVGTW